jgi:hypothetical protein
VSPVRLRERATAYSRATEPDIESMRGRAQRAESGSVSTGINLEIDDSDCQFYAEVR